MKYFIFDMGGILKKSSSTKPEIMKTLSTYAHSNDKKIELLIREYYSKYQSGLIDTEEYVRVLGPYFNKKNMSAKEYKREFLTIGKKYGKLYKNTNYIIDALKSKGVMVCLLSNLTEYAYMGFKNLFDVNKFDKVYLSYELHLLKPNKQIFEYVINDLKTSPSNIYFFDDNEKNIKSAKECGINAILSNGDRLLEDVQNIIKI